MSDARGRITRMTLAAAWLLAASGCIPTLLENPPRDARSLLPETFPGQASAPDGGGQPGLGELDWQATFRSPALRALLEEALANNLELDVQRQEVILAQLEVGARQGELFPRVSAGLDVGVEKVGRTTSQGRADELTGVPANLGNFGFGLRAAWEVDVWGRIRSALGAAGARARATTEARNFFVTQLVAEVARSYYELVALDAQLEVLRRNVELQQTALEVVRVQKEAARVTELAVQRFEAEVLKNRSRLFDVEQARVATENRLNFLLSRPPRSVERDAAALDGPVPTQVQTGVPARLLDNRPDVRQAALELEASQLDVASARAAFFPALSIDASLGYRAFNVVHLVDTPDSLVYALAGNLLAPLLNRAAIEAQYRSANARQLQAVYRYERTMLQAYTDVLTQLVRLQNLGRTFELGARQVETLRASVETSAVLFQSARADYGEVLLTRRDSLDAELELIETKRRLWQSTVDLYQALGGGWRSGTPAGPAQAARPLAAPASSTAAPLR